MQQLRYRLASTVRLVTICRSSVQRLEIVLGVHLEQVLQVVLPQCGPPEQLVLARVKQQTVALLVMLTVQNVGYRHRPTVARDAP